MKCMKKSAQSLIEYGLILALVAVIAISVLSKFGQSITNTGNTAANTVNEVSNKAMDNYCTETFGTTYNSTNGKCNAAAAPAPTP